VIAMRSDGVRIGATLPDTIARGCLFLLECPADDVASAAIDSKRLLVLAPDISG
jgi:hypothetical protein